MDATKQNEFAFISAQRIAGQFEFFDRDTMSQEFELTRDRHGKEWK
jgi:hypothetical protein